MRPQRFASHIQVLAFLLALCFRTAAHGDNDSDLRDAAKRGDVDAVKSLLGKGANINSKDADGRTALLEASYWGQPDVVKLLLDKGADVNAADQSGHTAVVEAAQAGHVEILKA